MAGHQCCQMNMMPILKTVSVTRARLRVELPGMDTNG